MRLGPFVAFAAVLLLPVTAGAQSLGGLGSVSAEPFTLSVNPQYPSPYSEVMVSVTSSSLTLVNSTLTVSVDGKETYKGPVHTFPVELGGTGTITNVRVTVSSMGSSYRQTLPIQPQDVVLIAEPISSAPPLYPGKPFVPLNGSVRFVAMANLKGANGKASSPATY